MNSRALAQTKRFKFKSNNLSISKIALSIEHQVDGSRVHEN